MKVAIATPTVQGTVTSAYVRSIVSLTKVLRAESSDYFFMTVDGADVVTARNILTNAFLRDPELTHLVFLDSDMSISPEVFGKLFGMRVPIIGVAYPERSLDLAVLASSLEKTPDLGRAKAAASSFTVRLAPGPGRVTDGMLEVEGMGFGCVVIMKSLLERLIKSGLAPCFESRKLGRLGMAGDIFDFFGQISGPDGELMSEDNSFCSRVRSLGDTTLLAYAGPGVAHVGQFSYDATLLDWLRNRAD